MYDDHPHSAPNPLNRLKYKAMLSTPLYAPNVTDMETHRQTVLDQQEMRAYRPWLQGNSIFYNDIGIQAVTSRLSSYLINFVLLGLL